MLVSFNQFGSDFKVSTGATVPIPAQQTQNIVVGHARVTPFDPSVPLPTEFPGAFPPDPDEFQFDPWDIPDPVDIPFPPDDPFEDIPPLPDPFDDPFNDLPDPPPDLPPLPGGDLPDSNYSPGTVNVSNTGGAATGKSVQPQPQAGGVQRSEERRV